jgi:hypothetical protein
MPHLPPVALFLALSVAAPQAFSQLQFSSPSLSPSALGSASASYLREADLNGDAYPDLLVSSQSATMTAINQGPPSFGFTSTIVSGIGGERIYAADFDGDGDSDLMLSVAQPPEIQFLLNDGTGAFPGPIHHYALPSTDLMLYDLAAANFDGDSALEVVALKRSAAPGSPWYLELFDTDFSSLPPRITSRTAWDSDGYTAHDGLAVADLDRDGDLDFWSTSHRVFANDGAGNFTVAGYIGRRWPQGLTTGDIDGDGVLDLVQATGVQCCSDPGVTTYVTISSCSSSGGIGYREEQGTLPNRYAYYVQTADFDGDGQDEILTCLAQPFEVLILDTSAAGAPESAGAFLLESTLAYGAAIDIDRDGRPDYVSVHGGSIRVRLNQTAVESGMGEYVHEPEWPLAGVPPLAIWVDRAHPGSPPDGSCSAPFATIEDALAAARSTDVVYVRPGRYSCFTGEPNTLVLPQGVSLIGVGGPEVTSIENIEIDCASGCHLSGFTLVNRGGMTGAAMIDCSGAEVRGNVLLGYGAVDGIRIKDALPSRVVSNVVHFCSTGILVESSSGLPSAEIYHNTIVENRKGIEYSEANALRIVGNLIVNSNSYGIHHHCKGTTLNELLVDYNYVAGNSGGNYTTTIALGQSACNTPFSLVPGAHDQTAPTFDSSWFVDASGDDFHLSPTCPLRDQGDPSPLPLWLRTDVDGDPRSVRSSLAAPLSGMVPDIGADELHFSRLELENDSSSVTFVARGVSSGLLELKLFGAAPGLFPLGSPFHGQMLLNPFLLLFATSAATPNASGEVPLQIPLSPGLCGARVFVQSLVIDPVSLEGVFTNAVAYTTR